MNVRKVAIVVLFACVCICGLGRAEVDSTTNAQLKKMLERYPKADANGDGVLTLSEAKAFKQKQRGGRQKGQGKDKGGQNRPKPTFANVKYGPHERNVLDIYQAKSAKPTALVVYIHGGGFVGGSKNAIPPELLKQCLEAGIACASINYRLSGEAIYPAQMHDSARALQFIRSKAAEWNVDPKRVAAGGGSAGSGISQWLGFHDDLASPKSDDPIARQSTRLTAVLALNMQSTYDPRQIKNIVPGNAYDHPALKQLFGLPQDWNWLEAKIDRKLDAGLKDVSPITHLTKDDPPVFIFHYAAANNDGNIHHPNFGKHLKKAMDALGIECIRKMDTDFKTRNEQYTAQVEFLKKHFGIK